MNISCPSVRPSERCQSVCLCALRARRTVGNGGGGGGGGGGELTVARVMTNAALLEHSLMSGSCAMTFFTLDTVGIQVGLVCVCESSFPEWLIRFMGWAYMGAGLGR